MKSYDTFLQEKSQYNTKFGFAPVYIPDFLYDFQKQLVQWALEQGRAAIFADCGLGKTPIQLVWADNIVKHTNKNVLICTPLSVSRQTEKEAEKFQIQAKRSKTSKIHKGITISNYEKLHLYDPNDFIGFVADESSILKNFDGIRKKAITDFIKKMPYRLLCTATAAPNDYIEFGTSSEALGYLGFIDMLNCFFKNNQNTTDTKSQWGLQQGNTTQKWRFKGHAEPHFWRWVCSWAKALRKPSDLGDVDDNFILPSLIEKQTILPFSRPLRKGTLLPMPAIGLKEQREERRATIEKRCECVAQKVDHKKPAVTWCHLNDEGNLLERLIPDAVQISGSMSDDAKEEAYIGFTEKQIRVLINKPKIGAFGLNWQHCAHTTFFPSHSYEQYYQAIRRFWRFGQKNDVTVDMISTAGEVNVLKNLQKKAKAADKMFDSIVKFMNNPESRQPNKNQIKTTEIPKWMQN